MRDLYRELKEKARVCRDRDVRIKVELICLALKLSNVSAACRRMGFSRKFYYRWWRRLKLAKFELWGLDERSRRPNKSPNQIPKKYEQAIAWYACRQYGARMIEAMLLREGIDVSRSTICLKQDLHFAKTSNCYRIEWRRIFRTRFARSLAEIAGDTHARSLELDFKSA